MAMPSANDAAQKWATSMAGAGPAYAAGVAAVSTAPGAAAARNQQGYLAGIQANVAKWARNTSAVSLQAWQAQTTTVGAPRLASGAAAAQGKTEAAYAKLFPIIANTVANLPARGTIEQNIARSATFARALNAAYSK